jgi:hypothetical protein
VFGIPLALTGWIALVRTRRIASPYLAALFATPGGVVGIPIAHFISYWLAPHFWWLVSMS